jgi:hypothetical protein
MCLKFLGFSRAALDRRASPEALTDARGNPQKRGFIRSGRARNWGCRGERFMSPKDHSGRCRRKGGVDK